MWDAEDHVKIRPLFQVGYMPLNGFIEELYDPMHFKRVNLDTWLNSHHSSCTIFHLFVTAPSQSWQLQLLFSYEILRYFI